jgi:hypothetical protein
MTPSASTNLYKHHRFPGEIISHAVWLYCRFPLSHWDVEELLFVRGVIVSYEAMRKWCRKFGQPYANQRRRRPRPGEKWHLDEVFITINKERHSLWRAVDQDGHVLDILVQRRRDKQAAKTCFRKLLKGCQYVPQVIITALQEQRADFYGKESPLAPVVSCDDLSPPRRGRATTPESTRYGRRALLPLLGSDEQPAPRAWSSSYFERDRNCRAPPRANSSSGDTASL